MSEKNGSDEQFPSPRPVPAYYATNVSLAVNETNVHIAFGRFRMQQHGIIKAKGTVVWDQVVQLSPQIAVLLYRELGKMLALSGALGPEAQEVIKKALESGLQADVDLTTTKPSGAA